ncbi:PREDICTED: protein MLP1-like isoform X2 [Papilio polytes]|uniref:protein MLP1-like isoform X2 n=1 Tax=Papilio polytes TaxID=76194 RepID=UPI00067621C8|nr:PREDICTED: protein MLP1-like isoform X2 [Papilio polytes]
MSEEKLCSDEVPQKFTEWMLAMGCPTELLSSEKIALICRGQYYMVWRSLMEHVFPKNTIKDKRLQVFFNDINMCKKNNAFNQQNSKVVVPEQLSVWRQHKALQNNVCDAENRLKQSEEMLQQLMDKIETRMSQRNISFQKIQDLQRRVSLLQRVIEELKSKKDNFEETATIANSLCHVKDDGDIQTKVDRCVAVMQRRGSQVSTAASLSLASIANPAACSSAMSTQSEFNDNDEVSSLLYCGAAAWAQLRERRAALANAIAAAKLENRSNDRDIRITPQSVITHSASLHCTLALELMKNRLHIDHIQARLTNAVTQLNDCLSGENCELLVLKCEKEQSEAKVNALKVLLQELNTKTGIFHTNDVIIDTQKPIQQIAVIDKSIESKREELMWLIGSLSMMEKKIYNAKECLLTVFNNLRKDLPANENYINKGIQLDFPKEQLSTLRQYYEERREKRRSKQELSLDMDLSENSFSDVSSDPRFVDELKIYLNKFKLELNRKLVLESGEKIWIFETIQALISRLQSQWLSEDMSCSLLPPSSGLNSLRQLLQDVDTKCTLEAIVRQSNGVRVKDFSLDIKSIIEEEAQRVDRMKKQMARNQLALTQSIKALDTGMDNLKFWSDNDLKKYISSNRTVDGKTYKEYESAYLESLSLSI